MNKTYKPRKDLQFGILIWAPAVIALLFAALAYYEAFAWTKKLTPSGPWIAFIVWFPIAALTWFLTDYRIQDRSLVVRYAGFRFHNLLIDNFEEITSVRWSAGRSHALASRQIRISSKNGDSIAISPDNQENFLQDLLAINPGIQMKLETSM